MTFKELSEWYLGLEMEKTLASFWKIQTKFNRLNKVFGNVTQTVTQRKKGLNQNG
jgi:hypothetical protein